MSYGNQITVVILQIITGIIKTLKILSTMFSTINSATKNILFPNKSRLSLSNLLQFNNNDRAARRELDVRSYDTLALFKANKPTGYISYPSIEYFQRENLSVKDIYAQLPILFIGKR